MREPVALCGCESASTWGDGGLGRGARRAAQPSQRKAPVRAPGRRGSRASAPRSLVGVTAAPTARSLFLCHLGLRLRHLFSEVS